MIYGLDDARNVILDFLAKHASSPPSSGDRHKILVYQEYFGKNDEPMQDLSFGPNDDRDAITESILADCEKAAMEIGTGSVPFVIRMEGKSSFRRFELEHGVEEGMPEAAQFPRGFTPAPTERGVLALLMRHVEVQARLNAETNLHQQRMAIARERDLHTRNRELERDHVRGLQLYEELLTHRHEREMSTLVAERAEERRDYLARNLVPIAQTVAGKFLGGGVAVPQPGRETPLEQLVMSVVKSMSPEEMQRVAAQLTPGNRVAFFELFQAFHAANEAREKAEQAAAQQGGGRAAPTPNAQPPEERGDGVH